MIWVLMFFFVFLMSVKNFLFFSNLLILDSYPIFMMSLCPLIFVLLFYFFFCFSDLSDFMIFKVLFFLVVSMVFLTFIFSSPFYFLIFLEFTVVPMSVMIMKFSKESDNLISLFFMFLINMMGSVPFMGFCLFMLAKSDYFFSVSNFFFNSIYLNSSFFLFCFLLVLLSKLPIFFLHFWLTKAHVSASGACSMVLASLMLKLGSFGIFKFSSLFLLISNYFLSILTSVCNFSCLFFSLVMIRFLDLKYAIACSSVLHMALIVPLTLKFSLDSVFGPVLMMVGHGLISFILFYLVSISYEAMQSRSLDLIKSSESFFKSLSIWIFIYSFLNLGLPPLISFFSELIFCLSLLSFSYLSMFFFSVSMIIIIFFVMNLLTKFLFGKKSFITINGNFLGINFYSFFYLIMTVSIIFFF